jgi:hypothetical protein
MVKRIERSTDMQSTSIVVNDVTFDQVLSLALRLRPIDQARLAVRLAPKVEMLLEQIEPLATDSPRKRLRGMLKDLGPAPSAEDMEEVQREMWARV